MSHDVNTHDPATCCCDYHALRRAGAAPLSRMGRLAQDYDRAEAVRFPDLELEPLPAVWYDQAAAQLYPTMHSVADVAERARELFEDAR